MRARLARRQAAGRVADAVHPPLVELAADAKFSLLPRDDTPFTAAYLVDRGCLLEFERRVESLRGTHEDVELVFSGPWPPYSFSELGDA